MKNLNPRKEKILAYIVNSYVEFAVPIGSQTLMKYFKLNLSSSTIRNEMSDLEEMGFITHPHTSAGRVPTDRGYRYFVDHLKEAEEPAPAALNVLYDAYRRHVRNTEEFLERTLHVLSSLSHQVSLIFIAEEEKVQVEGSTNILDQPEFQSIEMARPVLNVLERRKAIQKLLREDLSAQGATVRIGSEAHDPSFRECSLISAPYFHRSKGMGVLGILGPRRMNYGRMISLVSCAAERMGESLERQSKDDA